ncbi:hypothetical protein [Mangrovihabitans endophyticus]|nr:hypothetical protein [Mangrovihabitans endophyticus]
MVTLDVDPGVDSTVVVTDATTGDSPEVSGSFNMTWATLRGRIGVDLDTATELAASDDTSGMDFNYLLISGAHGTRLHRWTQGDPSLAGCTSVPGNDWSSVDLRMRVQNGKYCVVTSDGRFGFIDYVGASKIGESQYVLWKRTS